MEGSECTRKGKELFGSHKIQPAERNTSTQTWWLHLPRLHECWDNGSLACMRCFIHPKAAKKEKKETTRWTLAVDLYECTVQIYECLKSAPQHGRQKAHLVFFASVAEWRCWLVLRDSSVLCSWPNVDIPLLCLEGNTIWPHTHTQQSFEINAVYYLLSQRAVSETTFGGKNTRRHRDWRVSVHYNSTMLSALQKLKLYVFQKGCKFWFELR